LTYTATIRIICHEDRRDGFTDPGLGQSVPTKVEFSRRGLEEGSVFEPVSPEIVRFYELTPLMANHYPASVVWRQKIGAIVSRTSSQARDVFDLHLLLDAGLKPSGKLSADGQLDLAQAKENILAMDFGQFKSQVGSYLEPDVQPHYDSEEIWDAIRWRLIEALGEEPR
jgi:hypothetical protein